MRQRATGMLIAGFGVVLIGVALVARLFSVGPAFERMTDDFRPELRSAEIAELRADLTALSATQSEFTTKAIPELATATGMTPEEFSAALGQQFPALAAGLQGAPAIVVLFTDVLDVLEAELSRFSQADQIPTKSLPATTVPWAIAGAGLLCVGVAVLMPRRLGASLAVGLGVLMVAAPLILSLPGKASAADTMNSHLKPVYTADLVTDAKASLAGMQAMGAEMQTKMLPGLAQMLNMSEAEVQGFLAGNFPAITAGLGRIPGALDRFDQMVGAFDRSLDNYNTAKGTSLLPIVWTLMVSGALVAAIGAWVLARRPEAAAVPARRVPAEGRAAPAT